jgi:lysophospholipase L1-like esterase
MTRDRATLWLLLALLLGVYGHDLTGDVIGQRSHLIECSSLVVVLAGILFLRRRRRFLVVGLGSVAFLGASFLFNFVLPRSSEVLVLLGFSAVVFVSFLLLAYARSTLGPGISARILRRLGSMGLALVVALTLCELGARKFVPRNPYGLTPVDGSKGELHTRDPVRGPRNRPGYRGRFRHPEYGRELVVISSQGFRDEEIKEEKAEGERRIFVLGDSQTFGVGVLGEETFPQRLEARLGPPCNVLNAGISGTSTFDQILLFEEGLRSLHPDVMVVALYVGNDLQENARSARRLREAGLLDGYLTEKERPGKASGPVDEEPVRSTPGWVPLPSLLTREYWELSSVLARTVLDRVDMLMVRAGAKEIPAVANLGFVRTLLVDTPSDVRKMLLSTEAALQAIKKRVDESGAHLLVVLVPVKIQAEPEVFARLVGQQAMDEGLYDLSLINDRLVGTLENLHIASLDLLPMLARETNGLDSPFFLEGHLNRKGHALVADAVAERLRELGWVGE